jgi:hypothetical protein
VNHHVVAEGQIVPERPFDKLPALKVLAHSAKNERRKHLAELMSEQRILPER